MSSNTMKFKFQISVVVLVICGIAFFGIKSIIAKNEFNAFLSDNDASELTISVPDFRINGESYSDVNYLIFEDSLINDLYDLIADSEIKSEKQKIIYDQQLWFFFIKNNEIVGQFDFFKNDDSEKTHIAFRSKKKKTVFFVGTDHDNVIYRICTYLLNSVPNKN